MTSIVSTMDGIKHINITSCKACGEELVTGQRFCDSCNKELMSKIKPSIGGSSVKKISRKRRRRI